MILKSVVSIPNFSLICLRTYSCHIDTWQFTFRKLTSLISYLSNYFCCIFLGVATSKLFCPRFSTFKFKEYYYYF